MTDESRIRELLEQILNSGCAPENACALCPELLPAVLQRLKQMRRVEHQLDAFFPASTPSAGNSNQAAYHASDHLPQIEGYDVECLLGRGGMGIVYKARHLKLNRIVALKMLLAGPYAGPQEVARFLRESRSVAELQHPQIVQVHDVGEFDGHPYFTMEYVEGGSLAQELASVPQPARRAAKLVADLAAAVYTAHAKGIIHRDLKPANILLSENGTPKIADFGLARHVDGDPKLTISGARLGTPSYMAPEQALGASASIGPSVDIYALGAILYEMLTGRPPFRAETAIETERQVLTVEAAPPSRLNATVPRDLETICLKCLQKDPARRYSSAAELADDLHRFLDGKSVRARPVGWPERLWRWGKRNRGVAVAMSSVALLLGLILVGSLWAAAHFRKLEGEHRKLAQEKGDLADQKGRLVVEKEFEREKAVVAEQREAGLRQQSEAQGRELRRNLYLREMNLGAQAASTVGGLGRLSQLLAPWEDERPDLRQWEWFYLNSLCHRSLLTRIGHTQGVLKVAWSPDGTRIASAGGDRTVCLWDFSDESPVVRLIGHNRDVFSVAWSPDGRRLASASWDHTVRVWDTTHGSELFTCRGHTAEVFCVAWSPDGSRIASGGRDHTIQICDAADGTVRNVIRGHTDTVSGVAWSPDSQRLVSSAHDAQVCIWDAIAGEPTQRLTGHTNWVRDAAWSPDGTRVASVSNDQTLRIWDAQSGQEILKCVAHTKGVTSVAWSPEGTQIATASDDRTVKVWLAATGTEVFSLRGHTAPLTSVAWSSTDNRLATAGHDGPVRIWNASAIDETTAFVSHEHPVEALAWSEGDGKLCASADGTGVVKVWDMNLRQLRWTKQEDLASVNSLAWHPAGTRLASARGNGLIRIWNFATESEPILINGHAGQALSVAWSPDGRQLATGGFDHAIRIWNATTGSLVREIKRHQGAVFSVAWNLDGRRLASASADRTVRIWDAETGEEVLCYRGHTSQVTTICWSPDGTRLASAGYDQTVQLWEAATGLSPKILRGHTSHVAQVIWSPDGSRLASACKDGRVKIWDPEMGHEALTLESPVNQMNAVAWSPDGMILTSAAEDHQIRIYDATTGYITARSSKLLPAIDHRLAIDSSKPVDWLLRAEISAQGQDWKQAAIDMRRYLLLKPNLSWHILDGLVSGPYPEDLNLSSLPETVDFFAAKPPAVGNDDTAERLHRRKVPFSAQGVIDFRPYMEHREHISACALFPVYSLDDHPIAILLGTDDQVRLWLNGDLLHECLRSRTATPDEDAIPATLKSGWNSLLVRVTNETGDHALYLRLSDSAADLARVRRNDK